MALRDVILATQADLRANADHAIATFSADSHQVEGLRSENGEGSAVRIFNDRGSFEAIAKVSADVMQGVVVAPLGYWRDSSRGKGTVNALSPGAYADLGRAPTFSDTLVEVAVAR
jgi:hypothetical protein